MCVFVIAVGVFFVKVANMKPYVPHSEKGPDVSGLKQPLWQWISGADPTAYGVTGVFIAAAVVFFAYSGFEAVANLGEETKDPGKDMARGLLGTLVICTTLYVLACFVLTGMVKYTDLSTGAPISDAFSQVGLDWAGVLIDIAAIAGLTSVILVDIVAMGRIGFARCRDGLLPSQVGAIHPEFRTPARITVVTSVAVGLLAAFIPLNTLAEMVSIGTLFAFLVVAVAVIVLRRTRPKMKRPFARPRCRCADRDGGVVRRADDQPRDRDLAAVPRVARARAAGLRVLRPQALPPGPRRQEREGLRQGLRGLG